jgi:hypothetical protein
MTIQRKIEQFRPLVESGYATTSRTAKAAQAAPGLNPYYTVTTDHHITLRIDVAKLCRHLIDKIAAGRGNQSVMAGGAIRLKINTSKERA